MAGQGGREKSPLFLRQRILALEDKNIDFALGAYIKKMASDVDKKTQKLTATCNGRKTSLTPGEPGNLRTCIRLKTKTGRCAFFSPRTDTMTKILKQDNIHPWKLCWMRPRPLSHTAA